VALHQLRPVGRFPPGVLGDGDDLSAHAQ
jgi:hypothetical protein